MLCARLLRMTMAAVPWSELAVRLRPFIARRVPTAEVDDVMQDVFVRVQRGLAGLRDDERFTSWLFTIARSSIAEHARTRARHPLGQATDDEAPAGELDADDRAAAGALAGCVTTFVAALPSPYREAVTLVELEGLTHREAADRVGTSRSGMKSRVQRGRERLRRMFEQCCEIELDARGKVTEFTPRAERCTGCE